MLPLSTVDGVGFLEFMNKVSPNYEVPSIATIKTRIFGLYHAEKSKLESEIKSLECIALTTDCWRSRSMESNISVTAHGINNDWKMVNFILTTGIMDKRHTGINLKD